MKRKTNKSKYEYEQILKLHKLQKELDEDFRPSVRQKNKQYEQLLLPFNRISRTNMD
jgi:hypothetical protein